MKTQFVNTVARVGLVAILASLFVGFTATNRVSADPPQAHACGRTQLPIVETDSYVIDILMARSGKDVAAGHVDDWHISQFTVDDDAWITVSFCKEADFDPAISSNHVQIWMQGPSGNALPEEISDMMAKSTTTTDVVRANYGHLLPGQYMYGLSLGDQSPALPYVVSFFTVK